MLKPIAIVARGTIIAQAIGLLVLPVLTRLYAPAAFGQYQLFNSILSVLLVSASLRYEFSLLRVEDEREVGAILMLCLITNLVVAAAVGIGAYAVSLLVARTGFSMPFAPWLLMLGMLAGGVGQFSFSLAMRRQAFGATSNAKVGQSICYFGAAAGIGAVAPSGRALMLADIIGRFVNGALLLALLRDQIGRAVRQMSVAQIAGVALRHREYPLFAVPSALLGALTGSLTSILIYSVYSAATSGQYGLVDRCISLPLALTITTIAQVFQAQFSDRLRANPASVALEYRRLIRILFLLALLPALVLMAAGPQLFLFVFGPSWQQAGEFARILAISVPVQLCFGVVSTTLLLLGRPGFQLVWEISRLAVLAGFWLAVWTLNLPPLMAVFGHTLALIVSGGAYIAIASRLIARHPQTPAANTLGIDGLARDSEGCSG